MMLLRLELLRPWVRLGDHVYVPCAEPDGQCIKLNPCASAKWSSWFGSAGTEPVIEATDEDERLADALAELGVVRRTLLQDGAVTR